MEQEGIYYYLVDGEDGERMVLADAVESLPFARSSEDGRVPHRGEDGVAPDGEHVSDLRHAEGLGVTHVALSEHDWTNPALRVHAGHGGEGPPDPAAATYDHADAIGFHRYDGRQYAHNSATRSARIRAEAANLARQRWTLRSNVVTAQPGHVVNVEGAPDGDLDGAYMIVRCDSHGEAREGGTGSWRSSHAVAPTSVPYRPAPRTPRPLVSGPETAFVVGPAGEEIHTDEHGRVMVQFHWDRARGHDESSTCWIRVAQSSAGEGFGTFFLPRIGMEVVVDFLGGNPDRPLVTGCVHNGGNLAQVNLPADRTQSYIRTRSSIGSSGYNEIRFEDRDGAEFISLHAQRNLIERVVNAHTTHVGNDHTNRVDGNDRETVQFDQELTVGQSRWKTVGRNETNVIRGERMTTVGEEGGNDVLHVINNRNVRIDGFRDVDVANGDLLHVHGGQDVTIDQGLNTTVANGVTQTITSGGWTMTTTGDVVHGISGHFALNAGQSVNLRSGTEMTLDATSALRVKAQTVTIASDTSVNVRAPAGIQHITPASETNVFTEAYHTIQNKFENILGKFAAYTIAMSIYGMKVDISGVKVDFYGCKLDNSTFKAKKQDITIDNSLTVNINVAAIVLIG
ncbi:MAG: type VI secretion system tip protein VgrG [Sandaracinaceae bacterium]|nr:type VI secretion system tip protein VgrG [Sandaracinaceae bacterium]